MRIIISIPDRPEKEVRHYAAAISAAEIVRRYDGASLRIETDNGELIRKLERWQRPRAYTTELVWKSK